MVTGKISARWGSAYPLNLVPSGEDGDGNAEQRRLTHDRREALDDRRVHQLVGGADPAERLTACGLAEKADVDAPRLRDALEMRALGAVAQDHEHALVGRCARRNVVDDLVDALARDESTGTDIEPPG